MNKTSRKKKISGFTIVELVVAMGIFIAVFAGTVTLIVQVVNLALSARQKTEVVAIAQRGLSEKIASFKERPTMTGCTDISGTTPGVTSAKACVDQPAVSGDYNGYNPSNFALITVTVEWEVRGASTPLKYSLVQGVAREY